MKILKIVIINSLAWAFPLFGDQNVSDHFYKDLSSEVDLLKSYYLKAEQSSEIAQTRFQRGLFSMSELSAMRAIGQFTNADESIDEYVSKVAGANIRGVLPWNKKIYKQKLLDKALELRLLLSVQEEDLQALLAEVEDQLDRNNLASARRTLEKLDEMMAKLRQLQKKSDSGKAQEIGEAIALLDDAKTMILNGVEQELDISELVEKASRTVKDLESSTLVHPGPKRESEDFKTSSISPFDKTGDLSTSQRVDVIPNFFEPENSSEGIIRRSHSGELTDLVGTHLDQELIPQSNLSRNPVQIDEGKRRGTDGLKVTSLPDSPFSMIETMDGRKIRVSRPPQDWPNGRANGYDSIYDDRPGGNLIKEEEIVFERVVLPEGSYSIKEVDGDRNERKWDFKISETGGLEERYSITNMADLSDFEVKSWVLRNQQSEIVDKLDGNNLHFSPGEIAEGDYSLEVEGVTGWSSPFTVVASVLR